MKKTFLLLMCLSLLLYGCIFEITTDDNSDNEIIEITSVIEGIFREYNAQNIDAIMDFYDSDFLHNGVDYFNERYIWEDRLSDNAKVSNISIVWINGNNAKISFTLTLNNITYYVPTDGYEDMIYLRKSVGVWKVYGNQNSSDEYYSITVETSPSGATIYLDGQNLHRTTPYTMNYISGGNYTIRVYRMGYNEVTRPIYVNEDKDIFIILDVPINPPVITITSPEDEETINDDEFYLSGYISSDFSADTAILTLNGEDQQIDVDCLGDFHQYISITEQENEFYIRATNSQGQTGVSDIYHIYKSDQMYDIRIELTWNTDSTDVDLHIWDPDGNYCYYADKYAIPNGCLEEDATDGYGPEIFTQSPVSDGMYIVKAHFYDGCSAENPTSAEVAITFNDLTTYFGPHKFTADGQDDGAWWDVTAFTIISGKLSKADDTNFGIEKIITSKK
jgi:uncharacterized protein YfaP (DUF2135 family)